MGFEVEGAQDDGLVEIEWLPFELKQPPAPLPDPRGEYIRGHWRDRVYRLALEHDVEIQVPRHQPRSTLALTLHAFAEEAGKGRACRAAVHRAFFAQGLDVSDEGVLREVAQEAGLDTDVAIEVARGRPGLPACARWARMPCGSGYTASRRSRPGRESSTTAPPSRAVCAPCWPAGRTRGGFEGVTRKVYTQAGLRVRREARGGARPASDARSGGRT